MSQDTHILEDWSEKHHDTGAFIQQFSDNLTSHIFAITGDMLSSVQSLADAKYYDFGHNMGSIVKSVVS